MAERNNAVCSICGNGYHVCYSCKDSIQLQPWKIHCCSSNCYKIFQVIRGFSTGVYTKDEFRSKLENIDLSNLENYREHIKALIKDALKEDSVETKIEEVTTEENVVVNEIKTTTSRKRSYRVNDEVEETE